MAAFSQKLNAACEKLFAPDNPEAVHVPWWLRLLFAAIGGTFIFLSFPDYNQFYLAWIALALELWAIEGLSARKAFAVLLLAGTVTNIGGFYWLESTLEIFGQFPAAVSWILCVALCIYQALTFAFWGMLTALLRKSRFPRLTTLAAFLTMECCWPMLFPWYLANSQHNFVPALQIADILGVLGVSAVVVCVNLLVFDLTRTLWLRHCGKKAPFSKLFYAGAGGYLALCMIYAPIRMAMVDSIQEEAPKLRIGMVEADVGIWMIEDTEKVKNSLHTHHRLSKSLALDGADLIVWPESGYQATYIWGTTLKDASPAEREIDTIYSPWFQPIARNIYGLLDTSFGAEFRESLPVHEALHHAISSSSLQHNYITIDTYYTAYTRGFATPCKPQKPFVHRCPHVSVTPDEITWYYTSPVPLKLTVEDDYVKRTRPYDIAAPNRDLNTAMLFGTLTVDYDGDVQASLRDVYRGKTNRHVYNTAQLIETDGTVIGTYHKKYLMPFGEYIPGGDLFPKIYDMVPSAGHLTKGDAVHTMEFRGYTLGPVICYEDILPGFVRQLSKMTPQVFINITDDAWFGKTSEPWEHMALAALRSVEHRKWLLRSTNTGVSVFVDANGRYVSHTSTEDPETLIEDVPMMPRTRTIYSYIGDVLGYLATLWTFIMLALTIRMRRAEKCKAEDAP